MEVCSNCGRRMQAMRGDRCWACWQYHRDHGTEKPVAEVHGRGGRKLPPKKPHHGMRINDRYAVGPGSRWVCDCGKRATTTLDLRCGVQVVTYHLCDDCAYAELERA